MRLNLTQTEIITIQAALGVYIKDRNEQAAEARKAGASDDLWIRHADLASDLYDKIENACCEREPKSA